MLKIAHLTVVRQLSKGQDNQLRWEYESAQELNNAQWDTCAFHNGPVTGPFVRTLPFLFRGLFTRKMYAWLVALKLSRTHDFILMRHITFDPFAFIFAPLIKNRISVHHAKEVHELRLIRKDWKGAGASMLERLSGRYAVRKAYAILGVTEEIAKYERALHAPNQLISVYSNGINLNQVALLDDHRYQNEVHAVFMCGTFSPWHGLDKLVKSVDDYTGSSNEIKIYIHLVGLLSETQQLDIEATETRRQVFRCYGLLAENEYRPILNRCDFGIASLALERKGLSEGSTLKVREMLALGLPIYSGHRDVALNEGLDFVKVVTGPKLYEMINFGLACKSIDRETVRKASEGIVDKGGAMKSVIRFIENSLT